MRIAILLLFAALEAFGATADLQVDWSKAGVVKEEYRAALRDQALSAVAAAGKPSLTNVVVVAEYSPEHEFFPIELVRFTLQSSNLDLSVECLYPPRPWLRQYTDRIATESAERAEASRARQQQPSSATTEPSRDDPNSRVEISRRENEVEARSRSVIQTVGRLDPANWSRVYADYRRGAWVMDFHENVGGVRSYAAKIAVTLADSEDTTLCNYLNTAVHPRPDISRNPPVVTQSKAREVADAQLAELVRKMGVGSHFQWGTNQLRIIRPNFMFTDRYREDVSFLTNQPRVAWAVFYNQRFSTNYFTFPTRGVAIYVDAETGEMLGGAEF